MFFPTTEQRKSKITSDHIHETFVLFDSFEFVAESKKHTIFVQKKMHEDSSLVLLFGRIFQHKNLLRLCIPGTSLHDLGFPTSERVSKNSSLFWVQMRKISPVGGGVSSQCWHKSSTGKSRGWLQVDHNPKLYLEPISYWKWRNCVEKNPTSTKVTSGTGGFQIFFLSSHRSLGKNPHFALIFLQMSWFQPPTRLLGFVKGGFFKPFYHCKPTMKNHHFGEYVLFFPSTKLQQLKVSKTVWGPQPHIFGDAVFEVPKMQIFFRLRSWKKFTSCWFMSRHGEEKQWWRFFWAMVKWKPSNTWMSRDES